MTAVVAVPVSQYKSRRKRQCGCCPYGYHIDTDFVRYCESVAEQRCRLMPRTMASARRPGHRPSLPLLLGISHSVDHGERETDGQLDAAVLDFERAFASAGRPGDWTRVGPTKDVTTVATKMTGTAAPTTPYNASTLPSYTSPQHLQIIRKQMASSLAKIKSLEEEVKQVPILQEQVEILRTERERLSTRLSSLESAAATAIQPNHDAGLKKRNVSVGASVVTREVGVNHKQPVLYEAGVMTEDTPPTPPPRIDSLSTSYATSIHSHRTGSRTFTTGTQTLYPPAPTTLSTQTVPIPQFTVHTQTTPPPIPPKLVNAVSQTDLTPKLSSFVYTQTPHTISVSAFTQTPQPSRASVAVARVQTTPIPCNTMSTQTSCFVPVVNHTAAAKRPSLVSTRSQTIHTSNSVVSTQTVAQLLDLPQPAPELRVVAHTQTVSVPHSTSSTQTQPPPSTPKPSLPLKKTTNYTQTEPPPTVPLVAAHTQTPFPPRFITSHTQTVQLVSLTRHTGTQTRPRTLPLQGTTATTMPPPPLTRSRSALSALPRRTRAVTAAAAAASRIPRPVKSLPAQRAFGRQLTYTVTPPPPPNSLSFSAPSEWCCFDSSAEEASAKGDHSFLGFPPTPATPEENFPWVASPTVLASRSIKELSNEMKGALKVLNDGLKSADSGSSSSTNIKSAIDVVQQEWFKVTSDKCANPLNVEDLLDHCEELSSQLLHYVVNMSDNAGNTALHYAVSYENFDVVSVLLDSKVCDINKKNKVGYTPVMLLMLLEIKSLTDKHVVRRLLQLADVNIRAKNNGQTALMLAVSHDRIDNVEMLIEAGADVNIQDDDGNTTLMVAAEYGLINMVKFLLAQPDCDLSIKDNDGNTALNVAVDCGNIDVGVLLYAQQHFSRGTSPSGSLKLVKSSTRTRTPTPNASPLSSRKFQE